MWEGRQPAGASRNASAMTRYAALISRAGGQRDALHAHRGYLCLWRWLRPLHAQPIAGLLTERGSRVLHGLLIEPDTNRHEHFLTAKMHGRRLERRDPRR